MKKFKKIVKWIGIGLGGLVLLVFGVRIILVLVFGAQLRATLRELKAQGVPLTVAEIAPPPVPDAENAALPVKEALALIPDRTNTNPGALKSLFTLIETNISPGKTETDISVWTEVQREEGAKLVKSDEVKNLYDLFEKAAARPRYNNNLDYSQGPAMLLPNLGKYRNALRLLAVKAGFEAQGGQNDRILDTILTGLKLNNKLKEEPTLISQLVRVACDHILIEELERQADGSALPADQVSSVIAELASHADQAVWVKTMDAERVCMGMWSFDFMARASIKDIAALSEMSRILAMGCRLFQPIFIKDEIVYLGLMSKIRQSYEQPYYQGADNLRQHMIEKEIPRYAVLTHLIFPGLSRVRQTAASHQAEVTICRVGLALKLCKQKAGDYPETLDKLAPEFLEAVPVDPFTGKEFVYRKDGAGFLLYSLGPNLKDDGGKPRAPGDVQDKDYDLAWKCGR